MKGGITFSFVNNCYNIKYWERSRGIKKYIEDKSRIMHIIEKIAIIITVIIIIFAAYLTKKYNLDPDFTWDKNGRLIKPDYENGE